MGFKQAKRGPKDGRVELARDRETEDLFLMVTHYDKEQHLRMSPYNASRVFAMLALLLEIPLTPKVGKAIKMG